MAHTFNPDLRNGFFKPDFFVTKTTERLAGDIAAMESNLKKMRRENRSGKQISKYVEDTLFEIQSRHWANNKAIRENAEKALADFGERWKRKNDGDPGRALLERQRFEAQYRLADDNALMSAAQEYINGEPKPEPPDRLEVLALEMGRRDDTKEAGHVLTKRMQENDYTAPWRLTDEGDALVGQIQAHNTPYGKVFVSADGGSLQELDIEDLVNVGIQDDE